MDHLEDIRAMYHGPSDYRDAVDWALQQLSSPKPKNRDRIDALERGIERLIAHLAEETQLREHGLREQSNRLDVIPSLDRRMIALGDELDGIADCIRGLAELIEGVDRVTAEALAFASADRHLLRERIDQLEAALAEKAPMMEAHEPSTTRRFVAEVTYNPDDPDECAAASKVFGDWVVEGRGRA